MESLFSLNTEEYIFSKGKEVFELGLKSNKKSIDWFKIINNHRKTIAHSGSKSYGLIKKEVKFINDVLITQINIRLRSIRVLISVNKGKVISVLCVI